MKQWIKPITTFLFCALVCMTNLYADNTRERVLVLTDIENEPDDAMSLIRFLTYSNQWDIEGLIATTSIHQKYEIATWRIYEILDAYAKVRENLLQHEAGYPAVDYLRSIVKEGVADFGMNAVGAGMDSEGSEWIIRTVDKEERPLWVLSWGGPNCLAQALWKVQQTRTPEEVKSFISKLRVYTISDQDDSGPWMRETFTDLFYIVSPGYHPYGAYHTCTWSGISGDNFHGRFVGADFSIVDNPWLDEHIRSKGPLGEQYPFMTFLMEGDSPSFMYLIKNGLGYPENPNWGSWGGRYENYQPRTEKWFYGAETRPLWADAEDEVMGVDGNWHTSNKATIWRWRTAYQNDFSARMDWTIKSYTEANHPPVVKLASEKIIAAKVGDCISLSAIGTTDPDGDSLSYNWFYYGEAGTFTLSSGRTGSPLQIVDADKPEAWFIVPEKYGRLGTMHIILEVTDSGTPALTRYERVIVNVDRHPVPTKPRILISSDIGGTDPDDYQSMAHLFMYSEQFEIEGLVSSPSFGDGSTKAIHHIIDMYEKDFPKLQTLSGLLTPNQLRKLCKQGRYGAAPLKGYDKATEGSDWIVNCARQKSDQPLWVLVWGGLEDVAQALHDAPDIANKIRVYWIGGPNKKWSVNSYTYIVENFPHLWMIENNASYRGFITDNKIADRYNMGYYDAHIRGAGHLGTDFINYYKGVVKMGDTPSLLYLMDGNPENPLKESWGGSFEKLSFSPRSIFHRNTTEQDTLTVYSVIELHFEGPKVKLPVGTPCLTLTVDKQEWEGYYMGKGDYMVRYAPKATAKLPYIVTSSIDGFEIQEGVFVINNRWAGEQKLTDYKLGSNWYTDKKALNLFENKWQGTQTTSKWRNAVLDDWANRWKLLK